jgi:hypothetical protein
VSQVPSDAPIPAWALDGEFFCVVRAGEELSIVCADDRIPDGITTEHGWLALKLEGPIPFSLTGVLASFVQPLAEAQIPVFAISTFNTDYVLIKCEDVERAVIALKEVGHENVGEKIV